MADANKSFRTEKIRDVEFTVLRLSTNDVARLPAKKCSATNNPSLKAKRRSRDRQETNSHRRAFHRSDGSLFIAGNQTKRHRETLTALGGGNAPTLSELPAFEGEPRALFRDAPCVRLDQLQDHR